MVGYLKLHCFLRSTHCFIVEKKCTVRTYPYTLKGVARDKVLDTINQTYRRNNILNYPLWTNLCSPYPDTLHLPTAWVSTLQVRYNHATNQPGYYVNLLSSFVRLALCITLSPPYLILPPLISFLSLPPRSVLRMNLEPSVAHSEQIDARYP